MDIPHPHPKYTTLHWQLYIYYEDVECMTRVTNKPIVNSGIQYYIVGI